jgi:hypothetical protein
VVVLLSWRSEAQPANQDHRAAERRMAGGAPPSEANARTSIERSNAPHISQTPPFLFSGPEGTHPPPKTPREAPVSTLVSPSLSSVCDTMTSQP